MMTAMVGLVLTVIGIVFRFQAHDLAWPPPGQSYGFSGPWQDTVWGRQQLALEQTALLVAAFGLGLMLLACHHWLRTGTSQDGPAA